MGVNLLHLILSGTKITKDSTGYKQVVKGFIAWTFI
jgi:hypothetical protein